MKTCNTCGQTKPTSAFFVNRQTKDGLQVRCKECHRAVVQRMYDRDHAGIVRAARDAGLMKTCSKCGLQKSVNDFFTHKAMTDGFRPDCKACLSKKLRERYERDKPAILAAQYDYNRRNADAVKKMHQKAHRRRSQDPEWLARAREKAREWDRTHPESRALNQERRRARLASAPINDLTRKQWEAIKVAFGNRCAYCGISAKRLHVEHVIPLARGGCHTARNIVPSCGPCNARKGVGPPLPFHVIPTAFVS